MLHCMPRLHDLANARPDVKRCTVVLRGKVLWKGEPVWRTALASPYPPALTKEWAKFVAEALGIRQQALDAGTPVPHADHRHDSGFPVSVPQGFRYLLPLKYHGTAEALAPPPPAATTPLPRLSPATEPALRRH